MKETVFNIRFGYGQKEVTLTILPQEDHYKVFYFGGVLGAICYVDGDWDLLETEGLELGEFPLYTPDLKGERLEVVLDENTVGAIGQEIEFYYNQEEL